MSTRVCDDDHSTSKRAVRAPVQARSRATVEAILGGAARVLASRGYSGTTTNHIAEAAGVSIGSLYQYFADKDDVIAAQAAHFAQETLAFSWDHLDDARDEGMRVRAWLNSMVARASQHEALIRVLFQEVPYTWTIPGVRDAMAGALAVVERLGAQPLADDDRRNDRAFVILRATVSVIIEIAADPAYRDRRESIVDELAAMIDAYLAASRRRAHTES
jgi:AcrR family transcriptional regulator